MMVLTSFYFGKNCVVKCCNLFGFICFDFVVKVKI